VVAKPKHSSPPEAKTKPSSAAEKSSKPSTANFIHGSKPSTPGRTSVLKPSAKPGSSPDASKSAKPSSTTEASKPAPVAPALAPVVKSYNDPSNWIDPSRIPIPVQHVFKEHDYFPKKVTDWRTEQQHLITRQLEEQKRLTQIHAHALLKEAKHKIVEQVVIPPTLLNGILPQKPNESLALMEKFANSPTDFQYVVDLEHTKKVIDIPVIESKVLEKARTDLHSHFTADAIKLWDSYLSYLTECITAKVKYICNERHMRMVESGRRTIEVEDSSQARIAELPYLRKSHETEAKVLVFHTNELKQRYAAGISHVLAKSTKFLALTKKMEVVLLECKTAAQLLKQRKDFDYQARGHGQEIKALLGNLSTEFDFARGILIRSKEPGHHAAAWQIINESHLLGMESLAAELDKWRHKFDDQAETSFKDTKLALTSLGHEYEYHIQDMEFVEKSASYKTRIRIALKAEDIRCKLWLSKIDDGVKALHSVIDDCKTWVFLI
jgi:hypothetical protein